MVKRIKFVLSGPNAGKTITLGEHTFTDGACLVIVSDRDGDNQPLPEADQFAGIDRLTGNLNAGVANITRFMDRAYNAFPEEKAE